MNKFNQTTSLLTAGLLLSTLTAQAQFTWDPDDNQANDGGAGTWDTSTSNWWDGIGASNTTWTNGSDAIFGSGSYQVDLTSAGVTVGDLTYGGSGTLTFRGSTASGSPADLITVNSSGATWDTGGGEIEFINNGNNNNTRLAMTSGSTLTILGGGTFDTGQNPQNNANGTWDVSGATLDIASATTLIGDSLTVGAFDTVKMADGSKFIHERNSDRGYANDWELNGTVTFDNRWARNYNLNGVISGTGGMLIQYMGNRQITLTNNANSFSGGIEISTSSRLLVSNKDQLGDVANDITLSGGGILRLNGVDLGSTREIILSGDGGSIVNDSNANEFAGKITGDGNLQIGDAGLNTLSNRFTLSSDTSDYTGTTRIHNGSLELGIDNALPSGTVLTIGGNNSTAQLLMGGFDLEIAGLVSTGSNTKQFSSTAASILTINVADGETYSYNSNVNGTAGNVSIVKTGLGTQNFNRAGGYSADIGDISVNAGTLMWDVNGNAGAVSVASGATLQIGDGGTSGGVGTGVGAASIGDTNITNAGTVTLSRSAAFGYDGVISGSGDVSYSAGNGALTLSQAQTYTGNTTIDKAVFVAQMANAISADSAVTLGGAGSGTSAFDMNGFDQEIGGLAFAAGTHTRELRNNGASETTLTLNVATGESYVWNANVAGANAINIVKTGDGTQTFGRNGGYSTAINNITVSGGELIWNNNTATTQTGTVTVNAGGTLSGSGILGGAITVSGTLSPGNSPGTMSFTEDLTLTGAATTILEFTGTGLAGEFDVLLGDTGNTLTAGGTLNLVVDGYTAVLNDTFLVFEDWASFSGSFSSITGTDLGGGLSFDTSSLLTDGTLTVVPEPSTYALLAGMLAFFAIALRRRVK